MFAVQEINSKERDQFWLKEELEERKRVEAERKRREEVNFELFFINTFSNADTLRKYGVLANIPYRFR